MKRGFLAFKVPRSGIYMGVVALLFIGGLYVLLLALTPTIATLPVVREAMKNQVRTALTQQPARTNRLYLPSIGVNIAIVTGNDTSALLKGAWHRKPANGNPKDGGNFVLSAHRFDMGWTPEGTLKKSPFYHLDEVKIGDKIVVDYQGTRYSYTVSRIYHVDPQAIHIENRTRKPTLTLYSCTLRGSADGRDVVEAVPLEK